MPESDITKRPKPNASDIAHNLARAGLSGIPVVGGPASELFSLVITPSLERRRDEWIESIANALKALEEKVEGFKIENLCQNEVFITTVMQASQAAIRNHQKEKLEALKNAVLNAALPNPPTEDLQLMFLNFVDSFIHWHLRLLKLFHESEAEKPGTNVEAIFPDLSNRRDFYDQVVKDLHSRGLIYLTSLSDANIIDAYVKYDHNTTDLGKKFLKFITSPIESEQ